uniref:MYND-type domain-containing protein n=1 Tax=Grammatophora oceanica TaxID=210454 RepID=A0A7S1UVD9_9STRA|mmetsp:Transcript_22262/g.33140  ORF Transcript_22262/g.33140 Transcript_22262/m.33140 type:complete len:252 (+) Transcript_22262:110-865(+)
MTELLVWLFCLWSCQTNRESNPADLLSTRYSVQTQNLTQYSSSFQHSYKERAMSSSNAVVAKEGDKTPGGGEATTKCCCAVCGQAAKQRCSRCITTWYCSVEHHTSDWKRHRVHDCVQPQVSDFFNQLCIYRGCSACRKWGEEVNPPLAEEELDMVAYPVPIIIFFPDVSGKFYDKRPKTFRAPQGKNYFTVRDLARTLAAYERGCKSPVPVKEHCSATRDFFGTNHIFFEGLYKAKGKDGKTGWRPFYAS